MQNWFLSIVLRRSIFGLLAFAGSLLVCDLAVGQFQYNGQLRSPQRLPGHDFGDTPSPAQMLALLKFQKKTPWFDLLREAGTDVFSNLSQSDRQIAQQFAENLIESRGINSNEVKTLMEKMNVDPKLQAELQNAFDRQGLKPPDIEQLGQRLQNIQKQIALESGPATGRFPSKRQPLTPNTGERPDQLSATGNGDRLLQNTPSGGAETSGTVSGDRPRGSESAMSPEVVSSGQSAPNSNSDGSRSRDAITGSHPGDAGAHLSSTTGRQTLAQKLQERIRENRNDSALGNESNFPENKFSVAGSAGNTNMQATDKRGSAGGAASNHISSPTGAVESDAFSQSGTREALSRRGDLNASSVPANAVQGHGDFGQAAGTRSSDAPPANQQWIESFVQSAKQAMKEDFDPRNGFGQKKLNPNEIKKLKEIFNESDQWLKNERIMKRKFANKSRKPGERLDQMLVEGVKEALQKVNKNAEAGSKSVFAKLLDEALDTALSQAEDNAQRKIDRKSEQQNGYQTFPPKDNWSPSQQKNSAAWAANQDVGSLVNKKYQSPNKQQQSAANGGDSQNVVDQAGQVAKSLAELKFNGWYLVYALAIGLLLSGAIMLLMKLSAPTDNRLAGQKELQRKLDTGSMRDPKDIVDAVDLFLLSRFGAVASWWNSKYATKQLEQSQPDVKSQVDDVFRVYVSSRYQPSLKQSVSEADQTIVRSTLAELAKLPLEGFVPAGAQTGSRGSSVEAGDEGVENNEAAL